MQVFQELFDNYRHYHVTDISTNRFLVENYHRLLDELARSYCVHEVGKSVEGRPIKSITIGNGPVKVLMWSQMHGNESTASRAILDILQFLNEPGDLAMLQQNILNRVTICIMPMLNPDGAVLFHRRNALNIDINRDAREFESPEAQILKAVLADFKADYAFNLHDQRRFYNISGSGKPSTIAFLAPAYNKAGQVNPSREKAMALIAYLRQELEKFIPGQVGIYDDTYAPRAFGDYTQNTGASTILVEAGWEPNDMEKEYVRKLNFCLLMAALDKIAENSTNQFTLADYQAIPVNDERLFDLLIRNATVVKQGKQYKIDIGIHRYEHNTEQPSDYFTKGEISDIGDLKEWYGFEEINGSELIASPGLVLQEPYKELEEVTRVRSVELVKQGILYVPILREITLTYVELPVNIVSAGYTPSAIPIVEGTANLLLKSLSGELEYVIINGFLWKLGEAQPDSIHGLVL